ncbi:MAG: TIGR03749 family integrating conjugative element protein [Pseudomonadota bacterium]|nr:TIGR03749 family integrating conjugative element protein [Pseudomonadota bacterium]
MFQFRACRRLYVVSLLPLALLVFLISGPGPSLAGERIPERIVWQKEPIRLDLAVGKERRVDFPGPVKVGVPPQLESAVRVQSIAGTVYLLAHSAFDSTRVVVGETESGRMYLLDVTATGEGSSGPPVEVYAGEESKSSGDLSLNAGPVGGASAPAITRYGYVSLTRFAAQQLYAPTRLLQDLAGVVRVPVKRKKVSLVRGASVTVEPLVAWRAGGLYLTAVKLTNRTDRALTLDPRTLRGDWLSAAFQHNRLLPKGDESDTTALYLISARPFEASL